MANGIPHQLPQYSLSMMNLDSSRAGDRSGTLLVPFPLCKGGLSLPKTLPNVFPYSIVQSVIRSKTTHDDRLDNDANTEEVQESVVTDRVDADPVHATAPIKNRYRARDSRWRQKSEVDLSTTHEDTMVKTVERSGKQRNSTPSEGSERCLSGAFVSLSDYAQNPNTIN